MIRDPNPVWDGSFPYEVLEQAGIGTDSTQVEVEKATFTLMKRRMMNTATQAAWEELRNLPKRLLADALHYEVDPSEAVAEGRARLERESEEAEAPPEIPPQRAVARELLAEMGRDLPRIAARPAPPVDPSAEVAAFPPRFLIDSLIEFDK